MFCLVQPCLGALVINYKVLVSSHLLQLLRCNVFENFKLTYDGAMAQVVSRGPSPWRPGFEARPGFTPSIILRFCLPLSFHYCPIFVHSIHATLFSVLYRFLNSFTSAKLTRCQLLVSR
jgi:hypothetical protein